MAAVMNKSFILDEIRRVAAETGGKPLGQDRFRTETGIKSYDWQYYWPRWNQALAEAGFRPNRVSAAISQELLVKHYAELARDLDHFPNAAEIRLKRRTAPEFPCVSTFNKYRQRELISAVADYCKATLGFENVARCCVDYLSRDDARDSSGSLDLQRDETFFGSVYLARSGRHYKIGKTNAAGRREYELSLQLPEKLRIIHVITTDDPTGIEAYWHKRFEAKRKNGEWFDLEPTDVTAFKRRRKFM
jgi:hypothetical protein